MIAIQWLGIRRCFGLLLRWAAIRDSLVLLENRVPGIRRSFGRSIRPEIAAVAAELAVPITPQRLMRHRDNATRHQSHFLR
jgi:hypothetical protein